MSYIFKMRFFDSRRMFVSIIDQNKPPAGFGENEPILYAEILPVRFYHMALYKLGRSCARKVVNPVSIEAENPEDLKALLEWLGNNEAYKILTKTF